MIPIPLGLKLPATVVNSTPVKDRRHLFEGDLCPDR